MRAPYSRWDIRYSAEGFGSQKKNPPKRVFCRSAHTFIEHFKSKLREALFDDCQTFVQLLVWRSQWYQHAQNVAVSTAGQQDQAFVASLGHNSGDRWSIRLVAVAVDEQLDRDHGAQGTDFADHRVLGLDGL